MRNEAGNSVILILIGIFVIGVFLLLAVFGTDIGERFGLLSQKKTEQQAEARGKPTQTLATLDVTPNPVIAGGNLTIIGSGFKPSQWIYFSTTCYGSFNVAVDSAGNTSFTRPAPIGAGVCTFDAYQYSGSRNNKLVLMATLTFEVVEQ